jgi:hypothetical protein
VKKVMEIAMWVRKRGKEVRGMRMRKTSAVANIGNGTFDASLNVLLGRVGILMEGTEVERCKRCQR